MEKSAKHVEKLQKIASESKQQKKYQNGTKNIKKIYNCKRKMYQK